MDMKEKIKKALLAEADLSFGISGYEYVGKTAEELDEARKSKKEKTEEASEESSKSGEETSESSSESSSKKDCELTESEIQDIKLSARQIRSLVVASIAESMVNESIDEDDELEQLGLLVEGKLTAKSKEWIKKFLPTIYAS